MRRPAPIGVGAALMVARVVAGFAVVAVALGDVPAFMQNVLLDGERLSAEDHDIGVELVRGGMIAYAAWLAFYLVMAWLVWRGVNWARIGAMLLATASILVPFIDWWRSGLEITLATTLPSLSLDILILLALSAKPARAYARRSKAANEAANEAAPAPA